MSSIAVKELSHKGNLRHMHLSAGYYDRQLSDIIQLSFKDLMEEMWLADHYIKKLLETSGSLHQARDRMFDYLNGLERHYFNIYSDKHFKDLHMLEKNNAKECIRVLKNVIRSENERETGFSALGSLYGLAHHKADALKKISEGFIAEFTYLFKGINGRSEILCDEQCDHRPGADPMDTSRHRSLQLDNYAFTMNECFKRYKTGRDPQVIERSTAMREKILGQLGAREDDWYSSAWHMSHIIKDLASLSSIVGLSKDELKGLKYAEKNNVPFQVTPYYLSLFDEDGRSNLDRVLRAQVLPGLEYCKRIVKNRRCNADQDFMGEKWTTPTEGITRRYPQILILKPYDSCPQICVYCQRNWELKSIDKARITKDKVKSALEWVKNNNSISEVLVTGGDPLSLSDGYLKWLLESIACIDHIERIRIGTRIPVTLPFRITERLAKLFKKYNEPGKREVCIVTHFEHPSEVTPDALTAIKRIREAGISMYNQQVFTYYNSRKFETSLLRKILKVSGIDPYYTFNTKGKDETADFRVPIARIEQERKEEARLLPGIVRTDEPVFNVPRLGKSNLRAWQDHEVIMIQPNGRRSYRFLPWESKLAVCDTYIYTDVAIYDYLKRLHNDGEDVNEYRSIWYYF